jgi:hypothetical protein
MYLYNLISKNIKLFKKGFTMVETLVGIAVFLTISIALYQVYVSLFSVASASQYKILAISLANEQFEIIRNLPYSDVGEVSGIPKGKIPHTQQFVRGGITFNVITTIRNIDLPYDGTLGGNLNDLSPADNKLVEVEVECDTCKGYLPITLTTTIAPKNLETASTNGALFIKVFDANGVPVSDADVHVVNAKVSPNIIIDDVTNINGMLAIVDAPPGIEAYEITVSKNGYSTDKTYATSTTNLNPTKPNATVLVQQVTQISFVIDRVSNLTIKSVGPTCVVLPDFNFTMTGAKTKGVNIPKFSSALTTNSSGLYNNTNIEWDTYSIMGTDSSYDIYGLNPLSPNEITPNSSETVMIIGGPKTPKSLLVTVKDSVTGLPVTGATVKISDGDDFEYTQITDRGYFNQTDWSNGSGQVNFSDELSYFYDDGNLEISSPSGELKLKNTSGSFASTSEMESSIIDLGSTSNFHKVFWTPTDQPIQTGTTSLRIQFATNSIINASTTWVYKGPDGTSNTYYTASDTNINTVHNGDRYVRYKIYLSTLDNSFTPNLSDIYFTYTSDCTPPGQVIFKGLSTGSYTITTSRNDYPTTTNVSNVSSSWQEQTVILTK